jgi:acyl-CoA dehydrogenase
MDIEQFARAQVGDRDLRAEPAFPRDIWQAMAEAGLFRIGLDAAQGGSGGDYADIARTEAALIAGGGSPGLGSAWASHQMVARYFVERFGDAAQRAAYLPALASGRITASVVISEPGAGAHPKHLRTTATRRSDAYLLEGEKAYITNGPIADLFIVLAITATENGRKRYSAFLVPQNAPGLSRVPMPEIAALRPALHCGLRLTGCEVPAANRIGPEHEAYETMALPFRDVEDAVGSAGMVGTFRAVLRRLGRLPGDGATPDDAASLGALAALVALMAEGSHAVVAALDDARGAPPDAPALVGIRVLAAEVLTRARQFHNAHGAPDARLAALFDGLNTSLGVARTARLARQSRLGEALLRSG